MVIKKKRKKKTVFVGLRCKTCGREPGCQPDGTVLMMHDMNDCNQCYHRRGTPL